MISMVNIITMIFTVWIVLLVALSIFEGNPKFGFCSWLLKVSSVLLLFWVGFLIGQYIL